MRATTSNVRWENPSHEHGSLQPAPLATAPQGPTAEHRPCLQSRLREAHRIASRDRTEAVPRATHTHQGCDTRSHRHTGDFTTIRNTALGLTAAAALAVAALAPTTASAGYYGGYGYSSYHYAPSYSYGHSYGYKSYNYGYKSYGYGYRSYGY